MMEIVMILCLSVMTGSMMLRLLIVIKNHYQNLELQGVLLGMKGISVFTFQQRIVLLSCSSRGDNG